MGCNATLLESEGLSLSPLIPFLKTKIPTTPRTSNTKPIETPIITPLRFDSGSVDGAELDVDVGSITLIDVVSVPSIVMTIVLVILFEEETAMEVGSTGGTELGRGTTGLGRGPTEVGGGTTEVGGGTTEVGGGSEVGS